MFGGCGEFQTSAGEKWSQFSGMVLPWPILLEPEPRCPCSAVTGWCWLVLVGAGWCWLAKMKTVEKKLKSTNKHDLELPTEAGIHFIGKLMRRSNERALEPWLKEYVSALSLQAFQAPA